MSTFVSTPMEGPKSAKAKTPSTERPAEPRPSESSFELVKRACAGDEDAKNEVCRIYRPRLQAWARGRLPALVRPSMETGDVVQEVLLLAMRSFPGFDPRHQHSFPAFLRTILTNRLADLARSGQRRPVASPLDPVHEPPSGEPSPFRRAEIAEQQAQVDAALGTLSQTDQTYYFLRMELDYDYETMVDMIGEGNSNSVRVATRRAVERLAKQIARQQSR